MNFVRPSTDYSSYGKTMSLCETCLKLVHAKVVIEGDNVFYLKRCPSHGMQKTLVSTDAAYFKSCKDFIKPGDLPLHYQSTTEHGCPYDCGLCPDHEQHSCLALIEINDACNLSCPVCFADSSPQRTRHRTLTEVDAMLETLVASEGSPDLVQISGGEPTIHPQIIAILQLAKSKPIRHVMLNTNGIRIATDKAFVAELAALKPGFEIYLQFDSLRREALENLRGADLRKVREQALANLEEAGISTTLVCVVKKGVTTRRAPLSGMPSPTSACAASPSSRCRMPAAIWTSTRIATASCSPTSDAPSPHRPARFSAPTILFPCPAIRIRSPSPMGCAAATRSHRSRSSFPRANYWPPRRTRCRSSAIRN